ncbi:MAG: tannase/feruloyl esterase family alpha/beta hydrolase [Betaproteobacteria bacterium]
MQRSTDWTTFPGLRATSNDPRIGAAVAAGILAIALTGCATGPAPQLQAVTAKPGDCSALVKVGAEMATITSATPVAAAETIGTTKVSVPFCRVQGVAKPSSDSLINFEVWLPSTRGAWTGRLKTDGTGGYAGATPFSRMAADLAQGFVVAGSDMGHTGGESADWTMGHPEKVKDWGYRAHYFVTTAAKALTSAYYGKPAARAYFEGCSNGGRQAMMMAQRYPDLFDGIVAGAPSQFYGDTLLSLIWTGHSQVPVLGQPPVLSVEKRAMMTARAMAACDAQDGLADQQITNPRACNFDPGILQCTAGETPDCLTADQMRAARNVYRGIPAADGGQRWNGPVVGSEADWIPAFADTGGYAVFVGHFVDSQLTPPFKPRELNVAAEYDRIKAAVAPFMTAPSPDLSRFKARGGKILQYHGWNDAVVAPHTSPNYTHALALFERMKGLSPAEFDKAVENLSAADVAAAAQAQAPSVRQFHRLFMLPNVAHCGGGTGPSNIGGGTGDPLPAFRDADHDVVLALARWVEQGVAPETLVATTLKDGAVVRQRPVCVYPKQARYKGSGNINAPENFTCVEPGAEQPGASVPDLHQIRNSLRLRALLGPVR